MDLREAIDEWIKWRSCERAIGSGADDVSQAIRDQVFDANQRLTQLTLLAEAAMEHCEAAGRLDAIWEVDTAGVEYATASKLYNQTYERWIELRESMRELCDKTKERRHAE